MGRPDDLTYYRDLYDNQQILPEWRNRIIAAAEQITRKKDTYIAAAALVQPIPWVFLGLLHYRERNNDFRYQLLNGESWRVVTVLNPVGKGPWASWQESTQYAMTHWKMTDIEDWGIPRVLMETEDWNGEGYERLGVPSPYNVRGTQYGRGVGKFVEKIVAGKPKSWYSPEAEFTDQQAGCMPILRELVTMHGLAGVGLAA